MLLIVLILPRPMFSSALSSWYFPDVSGCKEITKILEQCRHVCAEDFWVVFGGVAVVDINTTARRFLE
jgi:hypothetical protein